MSQTLRRGLLGLLAAALSVLIFHEGMIYLLHAQGIIPRQAWTMTPPIPPFGVPYLLNLVFWGGLWGMLFAFIHPWLPGGMMWLKGLIYGLLIAALSSWVVLPLIKGQVFGVPNQPLFAGYDAARMLNGLMIVGSYGLGLGIIYGLIARSRP